MKIFSPRQLLALSSQLLTNGSWLLAMRYWLGAAATKGAAS